MDYLAVFNLAAGHSAKNEIEHCWAPLSKNLTSVTLPACLPSEDKPPCYQKGLSKSELQHKEAQMFDNAMDELNKYWSGKRHDSFEITSHKVPCLQEPEPYSDHATVDAFIKSSMKKLKDSDELQEIHMEYKICSSTVYTVLMPLNL